MAKRSRRLGATSVLLLSFMALPAAYVAAPFWTAWSIREAIRDNDTAYLEHKIEWESVRASLKTSLSKYAFSASGEMTPASHKPGLWQRFKTYMGRGAVDKFVETTVTPTGMAGIFSARKAYKTSFAPEDPATRPALFERMRRVWSRVTRAEFTAPARVEVDMIDKDAPARTINCVLELRGFEWKMTELRIKSTAPENLAATRLLNM